MHAQPRLVFREQLLLADVERLDAQIDELDHDAAADLPEGMHTGRELSHESSIDEQQARMRFRHLADDDGALERRRSPRKRVRSQGLHDALWHRYFARDIDELGLDVHDALPEQRTALRRDPRPGMPVTVNDGDLAGARFDAHEQILDGFGLPAHEIVEQPMLEARLREVEALHFDALVRIEEAIDRRRQKALEVAVAEQDPTLVLTHRELSNEQHGPSPQQKS